MSDRTGQSSDPAALPEALFRHDPPLAATDDPEWFLDLYEGALSPSEERSARSQLHGDPELARRYESYRARVELLRQMGREEAAESGGPALRARILAAVTREMDKTDAPVVPLDVERPRWSRGSLWAMISSGMLAAACLVMFFRGYEGVRSSPATPRGTRGVTSALDEIVTQTDDQAARIGGGDRTLPDGASQRLAEKKAMAKTEQAEGLDREPAGEEAGKSGGEALAMGAGGARRQRAARAPVEREEERAETGNTQTAKVRPGDRARYGGKGAGPRVPSTRRGLQLDAEKTAPGDPAGPSTSGPRHLAKQALRAATPGDTQRADDREGRVSSLLRELVIRTRRKEIGQHEEPAAGPPLTASKTGVGQQATVLFVDLGRNSRVLMDNYLASTRIASLEADAVQPVKGWSKILAAETDKGAAERRAFQLGQGLAATGTGFTLYKLTGSQQDFQELLESVAGYRNQWLSLPAPQLGFRQLRVALGDPAAVPGLPAERRDRRGGEQPGGPDSGEAQAKGRGRIGKVVGAPAQDAKKPEAKKRGVPQADPARGVEMHRAGRLPPRRQPRQAPSAGRKKAKRGEEIELYLLLKSTREKSK